MNDCFSTFIWWFWLEKLPKKQTDFNLERCKMHNLLPGNGEVIHYYTYLNI